MPEWKISPAPVDYSEALSTMETRVDAIIAGDAAETIWLLEHPPLYTAGSSARDSDLLDGARFPVYRTGRGGEYTYHGPGQRIAYVMLDLKKRFSPAPPDLRVYVQMLERWVIATLAEFGVKGEIREGRVGVWVAHADGREEKIAALGIRLRKWVSYHGIAINVNPDLSHYAGIVPCGIREHGVTSLERIVPGITIQQLDAALKNTFADIFEKR